MKMQTLVLWATMGVAAVSVGEAMADQRIDRMSMNSDTVYLSWPEPSSRFIVEAFDSPMDYPSNTICIASSDGHSMDIIGFPRTEKDTQFYRVKFGLQAVDMPDSILEEAVRGWINSWEKRMPTNRIYDVEVQHRSFLNIDSLSVSSLEGLEAFSSLEELYMWYNNVTDLSPLSYLSNLRLLEIGWNPISDLSPISNLPIQSIQGQYMDLSDLSPLRDMDNLYLLELSGNKISDLSPLTGLTNNLHYLNLSDNQISDLSPLVTNVMNGGFQSISYFPEVEGPGLITLFNNPLSEYAITNQIPLIESYGVTVEY